MDTVQTKIDYKEYFENGVDYTTYKENFQMEMGAGDLIEKAEYLPQNWQRQSRIDRKLNLKGDLLNALSHIKEPQNWLVVTENWCGDASQINPVINKVAEESNGKINLRFVYRDKNLELIDAHLTDGKSRSIPILLQLDENYQFMRSYGPRPTEAQSLVKSLLKEGEPYSIALHTWYAKNKQQDIQDGIITLLQG